MLEISASIKFNGLSATNLARLVEKISCKRFLLLSASTGMVKVYQADKVKLTL